MTTLAERVQAIASSLDCGLGDLDAVKCRLRDTLDVIADLINAQTPVAHARITEGHAALGDTACGERNPAVVYRFETGRRTAALLDRVTCEACREIVLRLPEYHAEWEQAASAHAKTGAGPEGRREQELRTLRRRGFKTELDGWRRWLVQQPIANEVPQEALDDLAHALAGVRRAPS